MDSAWHRLGRLIHWLITPVLAVRLPFTKRTRVLILCGDHILVVRGWLSDGRWQLPGGGLHRGEEAAAGARRELREETAINLPAGQLPGPHLCHFRDGLRRFPFYLFILETSQAMPARPQPPEITACEWVDYKSLSKNNAGNDVMVALETWRH